MFFLSSGHVRDSISSGLPSIGFNWGVRNFINYKLGTFGQMNSDIKCHKPRNNDVPNRPNHQVSLFFLGYISAVENTNHWQWFDIFGLVLMSSLVWPQTGPVLPLFYTILGIHQNSWAPHDPCGSVSVCQFFSFQFVMPGQWGVSINDYSCYLNHDT